MRRFGHVVDTPEVGLELGAEVTVVGGLDGRDVGIPRIVDDDVQTSQAGAWASAIAACDAAASVTSREMAWMRSP